MERVKYKVKNRFRLLKVPLNQKQDQSNGRTETEVMGRVLGALFVLHNILIDLNDNTEINEELNDRVLQIQDTAGESDIPQDGTVACAKREQIRQYLWENREHIRSTFG